MLQALKMEMYTTGKVRRILSTLLNAYITVTWKHIAHSASGEFRSSGQGVLSPSRVVCSERNQGQEGSGAATAVFAEMGIMVPKGVVKLLRRFRKKWIN
jgi:hypothetical protein